MNCRFANKVSFAAAAGRVLALASHRAEADEHIELALGVNPTVLQDEAYEAFSGTDLAYTRFGADARFEVVDLGKGIRLVPLIAYRFGYDNGGLYDFLDNRIKMHDFLVGLRLRGWFVSWFGVFVEAQGGLFWAQTQMTIESGTTGTASRDRYHDSSLTWCAGGLGGLEFRLSPRWLARRGVRRFGFGVELGAGYLRRGDLEMEPRVAGADEHAIPLAQGPSFGSLNLSGWSVQAAVSFSFL